MNKLYLLTLFIFIASSGSFSQSDDNAGSSSRKGTLNPEILKINLNNKIYVRITKDTSDESSNPMKTFLLELTSEKYFPCLNFEIVSNIDTSGKKIIVTLHGIKSPPVCLTDAGPASTRHLLELNSGNYLLILRYEGLVDSYKVKVRETKIRIDEDLVEFTGKWKRKN